MSVVRVRFSDPSVVDVKLLQVRQKQRKPGRSHWRVLQLHDMLYDAANNEWSVSLTFQNTVAQRKLGLRVLALNRAKEVVASIAVPARRFPKV